MPSSLQIGSSGSGGSVKGVEQSNGSFIKAPTQDPEKAVITCFGDLVDKRVTKMFCEEMNSPVLHFSQIFDKDKFGEILKPNKELEKMKRHVWMMQVKHYSSTKTYKVVAKNVTEAIKRVVVIYNKDIGYKRNTPEVIYAVREEEVYV
jgi:hypothetical protein